jgi:inner membrane protein
MGDISRRFTALLKMGSILFIFLLMMLPMARIRGLILERQATRDAVVQDIARSAGYAQTMTGPILIIPYTRKIVEQQPGPDRQLVAVTREVTGELRLLPAVLDVGGKLSTTERQRGIYRARIFNADTKLRGQFAVPPNFGIATDVESYRFGAPHLALGISDIRGIGNALTLSAGGTKIDFRPGTGTPLLATGVQAPVALSGSSQPQQLDFAIALQLQGTGEFQVTPVGRDTHVVLTSDWPHPGFIGEFLPRAREINADGFTAEWQTSFFATNMAEALARCQPGGNDGNRSCDDFQQRQFGVSFVDPVDQYLKSDRAAKYAFLFIGLTFAGFLLMEVLRRVSVHAVQYGLVGLALAIFFLLLLSFAEHTGHIEADQAYADKR